ncbi:hypothetical protein [Pseudomonas sp. TWP3-2]|uniref:hypothetical protein n=1 Tax=Pseudomonas sp. TWP3-2 TaxID=2804574 RepID=UPI003CF1D780
MAKIDSVALRQFLNPVNDASAEHRKAMKPLARLDELTTRQRNKVLRECAQAEQAYNAAVGELIGGVNKLVLDAEAEEAAQV